jgi:hypothetical protein
MMKNITVKRSIKPVIGVGVLGLCGCSYFLYNAFSHQAWALLYLAGWVLCIPVVFLIDYIGWEVSFTKKNIQFRRLFLKHSYSYSEIKDVREYYRSADNQYRLAILFADGRRVSMLSGYKNYMIARRELLRHMSIHS